MNFFRITYRQSSLCRTCVYSVALLTFVYHSRMNSTETVRPGLVTAPHVNRRNTKCQRVKILYVLGPSKSTIFQTKVYFFSQKRNISPPRVQLRNVSQKIRYSEGFVYETAVGVRDMGRK
jgi:hypothetical protein